MNVAGVLDTIRRYKLVSEAEIHSAEFDAKRTKGAKTALEILQGHGLVSDDQLRRIDQRLGKVRPSCFKCLKLATFDKATFTGDYQCPYCKETVSFKKGTAGHVEELLPNPPERAVDKIVERLLPKSGLTIDQIAKIKKLHRTTTPRPALIDLIARENMLPRGQAAGLKGKAEAVIRKKITQWEELRQDYELGRMLSMVMLVSHRVLSDALQHQFEAVIKGPAEPLRTTLQAKGELTDYQMRKFIPENFDHRINRQVLLDLLEEERQVGEGPTALAQVDVDWDDSMNELILESRELRTNLLDD